MDQFADDPPVEERVAEALTDRQETVAVAESATGGLVGSLLTAVPGSSTYFDRGYVTYAYDAKRAELAITREALDAHGAVSEPVARQMAQAARDRADVDWGISTTGVAGPSGGTAETPVGTVYVGLAWAAPWESDASGATVQRHVFEGDRRANRERMARAALSALEDGLLADRTNQ
ncbi:MAG: CinA family protein [Salinirussus sp.]